MNMQKDIERRFSVRFKINKREHKEAWDNLQKIRKGERNDYIISLLTNYSNDSIENQIKNILHNEFNKLREEIIKNNRNIPNDKLSPNNIEIERSDEDIDPVVMQFIESL